MDTDRPFISATIPDKTILGGWITSIPLNPFMSEDPSILKTAEIGSWARIRAYDEILLVLQTTGIQARAGIEVRIVDIIRRCYHGRKIPGARRNRSYIVSHQRSRGDITDLRCDTKIAGISK